MVRFNYLSLLSLQQVLKRRQVATNPQEQAGHAEMLQHVPCRVGMLSAFLDMARLLSQLLRIRP
ncbi:hypothetical protein SLEP1_g11236 [Rubroshorea leprosula]|uniref:Uncharacterized protein n=1 Tax=Rubroshorea leprosula TaxID=152421 RepID=A0AAV5IKR7_9ROSI|nr:hypothetical protein SLEP1_g11236 [Rubroshorea leprosula]